MNLWKYRFSLAENGLLPCTMKLLKIQSQLIRRLLSKYPLKELDIHTVLLLWCQGRVHPVLNRVTFVLFDDPLATLEKRTQSDQCSSTNG